MTTEAWHASDDMLRSYARGESGIAAMASIETHLMRCAACRERVARAVAAPLDGAWTRVTDRIHAPRPPFVVRLMRRCGLSESDGVLLAAARSLNGAWPLATLAVIVFAAVAAIPSEAQGQALYLLVAPLVPVAGVVAAFATADPLTDLSSTTPYPKARLALLRTIAVVITSAPLSIAIGVAVPGIAWLAFAWLLPALALTLITLVGMTWWKPEPVGVAVALVWIAVLGTARARRRRGRRGGTAPAGDLPRRRGARRHCTRAPHRTHTHPGRLCMNAASVVQTSGVSKRYGATTALHPMDLSIGHGVTGLLGPNGAGKTTLIRLLSTVMPPSGGTIHVLGHEATGSLAERTSVRRLVGYLPQELTFPRGMTAFAFLDYVAVLKEWTERAARHAEVHRVLEIADLGDRGSKRIRTLSSGQRRRLGLAQSLIGDPRLLILDEPTTGLDPAQRASLRAVLSARGDVGAVVLATHQTEDVAALCERVIVLAYGQVHFDGQVTDFVATAAGSVWLHDTEIPGARLSWRTGTGRIRSIGGTPRPTPNRRSRPSRTPTC